MYDILYGTPEVRKKKFKQFRFWNKWFVIPLYRANILPLFGAGRLFILMKMKGRKSGLTRYTPIEYRRYEDCIFVFSSRGSKTDWYRNIRANPDVVEVKKGFRWYKPEIEFIDDTTEKVRMLRWYAENHRSAAKMLFGFNRYDDVSATDFTELAEFMESIKFKGI